jgi:hypothetical protein
MQAARHTKNLFRFVKVNPGISIIRSTHSSVNKQPNQFDAVFSRTQLVEREVWEPKTISTPISGNAGMVLTTYQGFFPEILTWIIDAVQAFKRAIANTVDQVYRGFARVHIIRFLREGHATSAR